jgi:hypothetical protein
MTIHACSCNTCKKATFTRGINWLNGGVMCENEELLPDFVATVAKKGCYSHHLALQKLSKPVITALNKLVENYEAREPKFGTRMEHESLSCVYAEAEGMRTAINMLKFGVVEEQSLRSTPTTKESIR